MFKIFVIFFILFFFLSTFAVRRIHHSLLFYPRSFYPFQHTFDSHLFRDKYEIIHTSFFSNAFKRIPSKNQAYRIYILVIHLSFEPDFDWNKVNTLSIRERTCLHSTFKPCTLSVVI